MLNIISTAQYVFAIITLLGGVIAVHEFGHFIFAKWCGIRVDTFSIGFGPKLFSKKIGETEYCLSLIPLGGFVKIYGQDPDELTNDTNPQPERAFVKKTLLQKISVLFGGPLLNYILAIFIFAFLAMAGIQKLPPIATRVVAETPAYKSGLRSGDIILSIDGESTKTFDDVADIIAKNPEKNLSFSVLRNAAPQNLEIKVQKEHALTPYGEESVAGVLEGLDPLAREAVVATTSQEHAWGFRYGDKILEINDIKIASWEEMEKYVEASLPSMTDKIRFKVSRGKEIISLESKNLHALVGSLQKKTAHEFLDKAGLYNPELFVQETVRGAPADLAGLKVGDRLVSANKEKLYSFDHLRAIVQNTGETQAKGQAQNTEIKNALTIEVERAGKIIALSSGIRSAKGKDPLGQTIITYTIGILSGGKPMMPPNLILERTLNPAKALFIGFNETWQNTAMTVIGLKKLAMGEVSAKSVGGPIMIGKLAGDTLTTRGWRDFIKIMAIISISLGVFNLLPVPILDGGHIVFAVIESIRGKPLSNTVQQTFLKVGLSLILILMVFALYNDFSRVIPLPF